MTYTFSKTLDYYSAYSDIYQTRNILIGYTGLDSELCNAYYAYSNNDLAEISYKWKNHEGKSFIIIDHWNSGEGKITIKVINLENKFVKAFKFTADVCDVFGDLVSSGCKNLNHIVKDKFVLPYGTTYYTFTYPYKDAELLTGVKLSQVVYSD